VNAAELLMNSAELSANATEFWFFEDYCSFHPHTQFNQILTNFFKFYKNQQNQPPPIFFFGTIFQTLTAAGPSPPPVSVPFTNRAATSCSFFRFRLVFPSPRSMAFVYLQLTLKPPVVRCA
jgi:hypothetical protein